MLPEHEQLIDNTANDLEGLGVPDDTLSIISRTSNTVEPLEEEKEESTEKFIIATTFDLSGTGWKTSQNLILDNLLIGMKKTLLSTSNPHSSRRKTVIVYLISL